MEEESQWLEELLGFSIRPKHISKPWSSPLHGLQPCTLDATQISLTPVVHIVWLVVLTFVCPQFSPETYLHVSQVPGQLLLKTLTATAHFPADLSRSANAGSAVPSLFGFETPMKTKSVRCPIFTFEHTSSTLCFLENSDDSLHWGFVVDGAARYFKVKRLWSFSSHLWEIFQPYGNYFWAASVGMHWFGWNCHWFQQTLAKHWPAAEK